MVATTTHDADTLSDSKPGNGLNWRRGTKSKKKEGNFQSEDCQRKKQPPFNSTLSAVHEAKNLVSL